MSTVIVGVDIGTSSVKGIAYTENAEKIMEETVNSKLITPKDNWYEQDPEKIVNTVKLVLKKLLSKIKSNNVVIGFSCQSPSLVVVGKNNRALYNVITWLDRRAEEETKILGETFDQWELYEKTGLRLDPMFFLPKILWFKNKMPKIFSNTKYFMQLKDYIFLRLTGNPVTDYSSASETQLMNLKGEWDTSLLDYLGIEESQLPSPKSSSYIIETKIEFLKRKVAFTLGGVDSACAALGVGVVEKGIVSDATGTSTCLDVLITTPTLDPEMRFEIHRHVIDTKWLMEACTPTSGAALNKLIDLLGITEDIDNLVKSSPIGSNGLITLPFFAGTRSPDWDPNLRGTIYGLSLNTKPADLVRSIMEGIAFWIKETIDIWKKLGIEVREIRSSGGGAQSRVWTEIKANITQITIKVMKEVNASALGAALLSGVAVNLFKEHEILKFLKVKETFTPNLVQSKKYLDLYAKYLKFKKLALNHCNLLKI